MTGDLRSQPTTNAAARLLDRADAHDRMAMGNGAQYLGFYSTWDAQLMRAASAEIEGLRAALRAVQKLISEAAMTGFNCHDGDWAERLFHSQQATSRALQPKPADSGEGK